MTSLLLGKKTLPLQKRYYAINATKRTVPSSNKLIVVHVAIVKSPAVSHLTVLFHMRNKKKGAQNTVS